MTPRGREAANDGPPDAARATSDKCNAVAKWSQSHGINQSSSGGHPP